MADDNQDIHDTPMTSSTDRMHEMTWACWCKPDWKPRIGSEGRIYIHHDETTVKG